MITDLKIKASEILLELKKLADKTRNKAVHDDIAVIAKRINNVLKFEIETDVKEDYLMCVENYIQAVHIRFNNEKVVRFTHLPKEDLFKVAFRFVYDPATPTNYMAPAVEPMRDFLALNSCIKLPHEVQTGIFHTLVLGGGLNRHYMQSRDGVNEKTESKIKSYCEAIDRMTAGVMALSLKHFFD